MNYRYIYVSMQCFFFMYIHYNNSFAFLCIYMQSIYYVEIFSHSLFFLSNLFFSLFSLSPCSLLFTQEPRTRATGVTTIFKVDTRRFLFVLSFYALFKKDHLVSLQRILRSFEKRVREHHKRENCERNKV